MMDVRPEKGEGIVWDFFKANLPSDVVCYNNRTLANRESDTIVLIPNRGIFVIEIKSWLPENVYLNDTCEIFLNGKEKPVRNPYKQAKKYRYHIIDYFNEKKNINPLVIPMVCYSNMTKVDYEKCKLNYISEESCTIFREDLENPKQLFDKFNQIYVDMYNASMDILDERNFAIVRSTFEPNYNENIKPPMKPVASYSVIITAKELINRQEILENYFQGIKTIVFTSDYIGSQLLLSELAEGFDSRGLTINKTNIQYAIGKKNKFELSSNEFTTFNFSLFLTDIVDQDLCIEDGKYQEYSELLYRLEYVTNFNFEQYRVEHADLKHTLVKAGAGTGKTYSMVSRIAYLYHIDTAGIDKMSDAIVMLTFTNEAADNMRRRIKKHFMNYYALTNNPKFLEVISDLELMQISTIHKFANKIIQDSAISIGLGHQFAITDSEFGRRQTYLMCFGDFINSKLEDDPAFIRSFPIKSYEIIDLLMTIVDSLYQKGIDIKSISREQLGRSIYSIPSFGDMIIDVAKKAEILLDIAHLSQNEMQLRQMMIYCFNAINSESFKANNYSYKYVFIDEFQDTDDMQIDIFSVLQQKIGFKLFIVGDLKQSIYRFRGATMNAFDRIKALIGDENWGEDYSLRHNYRTDNRLLKRFNSVFTFISDVNDPEGLLPYDESSVLFSRIVNPRINESDLFYRKHFDPKADEDRLDMLFSVVREQQIAIQSSPDYETLPESKRSIAILVRTNREVKDVIKAGRERNIFIETRGGGDLYQSLPALDLSTLLSALSHPNDIDYLYAFINSNYVHTDFALQKISGYSIQDKRQILISCLDKYFSELMGIKWKNLVSMSIEKPILVVLKQIYEKTRPWLHLMSENKQIDYQNNYDLIIELILRRYDVEALSLGVMDDYLSNCIITGQEQQPRKDTEDDSGIHVICLTIHKSKGLEFEYVDLPYADRLVDSSGANQTEAVLIDGNVGYTVQIGREMETNEFYDVQEESIQAKKEEARILYVAMTRAISSVVWITNNRDGMTWNCIMQEGLIDEH